MKSDAGHFPEVPAEDLAHVSNPVRLADGINVVQKGKQMLTSTQLGLGTSQGVMDAQREQHGHQGVPLFAPFGLLNEPRVTAFVPPGVARRLTIRQAHEWQHGPGLGQAVQLGKHSHATDVIVGPYAVDAQQRGIWVQVRQKPNGVPNAVRAGPSGQGELEGRTGLLNLRLKLASQSPGHQSPERRASGDAARSTLRLAQGRQASRNKRFGYLFRHLGLG